jgi:hypothetical protein
MYSKQDLSSLGKEASTMFLQHGIPLNEAIVKIASKRPDMTKEHVQRVIENANLITFEDMFKGASSKHVTFDLADPNVVHAELDKSNDIPDPIYATEPQYVRSGGFDAFDKEASVAEVPEHVQWRRDYYATKSAAEHLEKFATRSDAKAEAKMHNFIDMCKRASLAGDGLRPVLQLAGYASKDPEVFSKVASAVSSALRGQVKEGEFVDTLPNKSHPVYEAYASLEDTIKTASRHKAGMINAVRMHEEIKSKEFLV